MRALDRYLLGIVLGRFVLVCVGFVGMFSVFELITELGQFGRSGDGLEQALLYTLLRVPGLAYDLMPLCALVGGLWGLADLAASREFTIFRASGFTPRAAIMVMTLTTAPLAISAYVLSEWVVPWSESEASQVRSGGASGGAGQALRSGYWLKDNFSEASSDNAIDRFINIGKSQPDQVLRDVRFYEFGKDLQLRRFLVAREGRYESVGVNELPSRTRWVLKDVDSLEIDPTGQAVSRALGSVELFSNIPVDSLASLLVRPEQMATYQLWHYIRYLKSGKQQAARFELAFWKKLTYPLGLWAMLVLSLPLAYSQTRAGRLGVRVFIGISSGLVFYLLNSLFAHLTTLGDWPAAAVAVTPSLIALSVALIVLQIAQRRAL